MKVLVVVDMQNDFIDGVLGTPEAQAENELSTVFEDGKFIKRYSLSDVRQNLHGGNF